MTVLEARSGIEGLVWPGLPRGRGLVILALVQQLEHSQWWSPEVLREHQFRQLQLLLAHAATTVPFYRRRLKGLGLAASKKITPETWNRIPLLTRREVQVSFGALQSRRLPKPHGKTHEIFTTGATATPIKVVKTELVGLFWQAMTLREHLWHGRDLSRKLAVIRQAKDPHAVYPDGLRGRRWGPASGEAYVTGPSVLLDLDAKIHQQAEWLQRENPDYLLTFASNLGTLVQYCAEKGIAFSNLKQVLTISEMLRPEARELCRSAWGITVADVYSAQELGVIGLPCPKTEQFHIAAEDVLVEVLDEDGRPCGPGEVGKVVVTALHNFAMPLIRYAIGDLAEVGGACACGRGLPVLRRVLGRDRDMVTLPNGEQHLPNYQGMLAGLDHIIQFQIIRRTVEDLEMKLVARRKLTESEDAELARRVRERFLYPFQVTFTYHDEIPRGPGGKFEDFRSEI